MDSPLNSADPIDAATPSPHFRPPLPRVVVSDGRHQPPPAARRLAFASPPTSPQQPVALHLPPRQGAQSSPAPPVAPVDHATQPSPLPLDTQPPTAPVARQRTPPPQAPPAQPQPGPTQRRPAEWLHQRVFKPCQLLDGEQVQLKLVDSCMVLRRGVWHMGVLYLSNYRMIFQFATLEEIFVPFMMIEYVRRKPQPDEKAVLKLRMKDLRLLKLSVQGQDKIEAVFLGLTKWQQLESVRSVFAFQFRMNVSPHMNGWNVYDQREDFLRMGVTRCSEKWRVTQLNVDYTICKSYPQLLAVPRGIRTRDLMTASKFRAGGRFPVLSWVHSSGRFIARSAQPLTGLTGQRSPEDEKLLSLMVKSSLTGKLFIFDMRARANAMANQMKGGGYENTLHYENCVMRWVGIANIHRVNESFDRLYRLTHADGSWDQPQWMSMIEGTGWMLHVHSHLRATRVMLEAIEDGHGVLLHCSDGWDRTPACTSLLQLVCVVAMLALIRLFKLLDPYYRTLRGFAALVEKDWLSMGHLFAERCGHAAQRQSYTSDLHLPPLLANSTASVSHSDPSGGEGLPPPPPAAAAQSNAPASSIAGVLTSLMRAGAAGKQTLASLAAGQSIQSGPFKQGPTGGVAGTANSSGGEGYYNSGMYRSPQFVLWLDCVHQLLHQFPMEFEFNVELLEFLAEAVFSCQFGTFLCNTDQERKLLHLKRHSVSVWSAVFQQRELFVNPVYNPPPTPVAKAAQGAALTGLNVQTRVKDLVLWQSLYLRRWSTSDRQLQFPDPRYRLQEQLRKEKEESRWLRLQVDMLRSGQTAPTEAQLIARLLIDQLVDAAVMLGRPRIAVSAKPSPCEQMLEKQRLRKKVPPRRGVRLQATELSGGGSELELREDLEQVGEDEAGAGAVDEWEDDEWEEDADEDEDGEHDHEDDAALASDLSDADSDLDYDPAPRSSAGVSPSASLATSTSSTLQRPTPPPLEEEADDDSSRSAQRQARIGLGQRQGAVGGGRRGSEEMAEVSPPSRGPPPFQLSPPRQPPQVRFQPSPPRPPRQDRLVQAAAGLAPSTTEEDLEALARGRLGLGGRGEEGEGEEEERVRGEDAYDDEEEDEDGFADSALGKTDQRGVGVLSVSVGGMLPDEDMIVQERPPVWMPDELADRCRRCRTSFGPFTRKHHCRNCGFIFCYQCSSHQRELHRYGIYHPVRVCSECAMGLDAYQERVAQQRRRSTSSSYTAHPQW